MDDDDDISPLESMLPYDQWTAEALRLVVLRALEHVAGEGLPGGHHFFITFRTDAPGVAIPDRLRETYPSEMTIVLQHQFGDLRVDTAARRFSVKLSFGGIPSMLTVPIDAVTRFVDPEVQFALQFLPGDNESERETAEGPEPEVEALHPGDGETDDKSGGMAPVVSLDAFRRRPPTKT